jgi:hypothetical protein
MKMDSSLFFLHNNRNKKSAIIPTLIGMIALFNEKAKLISC